MMVARSFEVSPKKPLVAVRISSSVYLSVVFSCAESGAGRLDASSASGAAKANRRRGSGMAENSLPSRSSARSERLE